MKISATDLPGVLVIEPEVYEDGRGFFMETWHAERYREAGLPPFVQDNLSSSTHGVLRGLHFQHPYGQGKLVSVLAGEVFDVAVDLRQQSPTFGRWTSVRLSSENRRQFFVPEGFGHGFQVLSDSALVSYKCTELYRREYEASVRWDDPEIAIAWPLAQPVLSDKDARAPLLRDIPAERLP